MGQNFIHGNRDQLFLMPPSIADWLPEDHLAWFIIDIVDQFDLTEFETAYRSDGRGGAAFHPALMTTIMLYAYSIGVISSRKIEQACHTDVGFRVAARNQTPDHATIARFRARHQHALEHLFTQILQVCQNSGLIKPTVLAVDGTKMMANASKDANRTAAQLAAELFTAADRVDAEEDAAEALSESVIDPEMATRGEKRRHRLKEMLDELNAEAEARSFDNKQAERKRIEAETGRPVTGRPLKAGSTNHKSRRHANVTDPDSRIMSTRNGFVQGFNAQAVVTLEQIVVSVGVTCQGNDLHQYVPLMDAAAANLDAVGSEPASTGLADAGYWSKTNVQYRGLENLISPGKADRLVSMKADAARRGRVLGDLDAGLVTVGVAAEVLGLTPGHVKTLLSRRRRGVGDDLRLEMLDKLNEPQNRELYSRRKTTVETLFGNTKENLGFRRFSRRGIEAVRSEWALMCSAHNVLKLWRAGVV